MFRILISLILFLGSFLAAVGDNLVQMDLGFRYSIKENVTLEDLNPVYFTPVGRTLPEDQIFKLEHFVIAES